MTYVLNLTEELTSRIEDRAREQRVSAEDLLTQMVKAAFTPEPRDVIRPEIMAMADELFEERRAVFEALAEGAVTFLNRIEVLAIQRKNIDLFGGLHGIRDEGALDSALEAPENRNYYEGAGVVVCGATYGFHLCQAHAFVDGNKRIAVAASLLFLRLNGFNLRASDSEMIEIFMDVAAGKTSRDQLESIFVARAFEKP